LDGRVIPNLNTPANGQTYGTMRMMAQNIADHNWETPVEKGLALSILAIIDDFEKYYEVDP